MPEGISSTPLNFSEFSSFLVNPPYPEYFFILKVVFIFIFLYFLFSIIYYLKVSSYWGLRHEESFLKALKQTPKESRNVYDAWKKILEQAKGGTEADYRLAIIKADSLLDDCLKRIGYKGDSLSERIEKLTSYHLPNISEIKEVHKLRNNLVKNPDYDLGIKEGKGAMDIYEKALSDLGVF